METLRPSEESFGRRPMMVVRVYPRTTIPPGRLTLSSNPFPLGSVHGGFRQKHKRVLLLPKHDYLQRSPKHTTLAKEHSHRQPSENSRQALAKSPTSCSPPRWSNHEGDDSDKAGFGQTALPERGTDDETPLLRGTSPKI